MEFSYLETLKAGSATRILEELRSVDISTLTPLDALNVLYRLQLKARKVEHGR